MRRALACLLLLAACDASNEPGGAAASTSAGAGVGGSDVGAGGDPTGAGGGGSGGESASTAEATAVASSGEVSASSGAGGDGGAGVGGAGGSGGAPPCTDAACVPNARVRCNTACPNSLDCDEDVCAGDSLFTLTLGESVVEIPPIAVQYQACEGCSGVMYSLTATLPNVDEGCVTVAAPPGVTWARSGDACLVGDGNGCELAPFVDGDSLTIYVAEPADFARRVMVTSYDAPNCAGVPAPVCDVGCNGAGD